MAPFGFQRQIPPRLESGRIDGQPLERLRLPQTEKLPFPDCGPGSPARDSIHVPHGPGLRNKRLSRRLRQRANGIEHRDKPVAHRLVARIPFSTMSQPAKRETVRRQPQRAIAHDIRQSPLAGRGSLRTSLRPLGSQHRTQGTDIHAGPLAVGRRTRLQPTFDQRRVSVRRGGDFGSRHAEPRPHGRRCCHQGSL